MRSFSQEEAMDFSFTKEQMGFTKERRWVYVK